MKLVCVHYMITVRASHDLHIMYHMIYILSVHHMILIGIQINITCVGVVTMTIRLMERCE